MPRSRPRRRKATPQVRRDAGYAILEAMPPLIACGFIGTVIAAGLMIQPPGTGSSARNPTATSNAQYSAVNETADADGDLAVPAPSPRSAELRQATISRNYEARLVALAGSRTGTAFHGIPGSDFTGNGNPDIMVTKPAATNTIDGTDPTGGYGSVEVWTMLSSSAVLTIDGVVQNDLFALSAKSAGDLDGDGADDIIVGAPLDHGINGYQGIVEVYSGSDGQLLLTLSGSQWEYLGRTVAGASDNDGDGQWDIAASSWIYDQSGDPYGMVSIHSGSDGALIRTFSSDLPNDGFGYEVISMGDLDGDTYSEVAISATLAPGDPLAYTQAIGRLFVYHGDQRATQPEHLGAIDADLTIYNPDPLIDHFAVAVELTSDQDSDGVADLLVTSLIDPGTPQETTAVQVFSSATGGMLWPVSTPPPGTGTGRDGEPDETYPPVDENGVPIHYAHYTSELGIYGDATRDLRVEETDLALITDGFGGPAEPGNPISGDLTLSGIVDVGDLNAVVGQMNQTSVILDFVSDPYRLLTRWSALDPYQYGDYVMGGEGGRASDPAYPFTRPLFPGFDAQASCLRFISRPGECGGGCEPPASCCAPGSWGCSKHFGVNATPGDCDGDGIVDPGPLDSDCDGYPDGDCDRDGIVDPGPLDSDCDGIPDSEDCAAGGFVPPTEDCPDACADDDGDGIPNQKDCDSPCFDDRYSPDGCAPCEDDDGDGRPNQEDCDSDCVDEDANHCECESDEVRVETVLGPGTVHF